MKILAAFVISMLVFVPITAFAQPVTASSKAILVDGTEFSVNYKITGGQLLGAFPDTDAMSLILSVQMSSAGELEIVLPRNLIDSKIGEEDDIYFVLIDADEVDFTEVKTQDTRTLTIPIPEGSDEIEIIGTKVVPEFPFVILIMIVSVSGIIFVTRFKNFVSI
jgi:hypothetical protein